MKKANRVAKKPAPKIARRKPAARRARATARARHRPSPVLVLPALLDIRAVQALAAQLRKHVECGSAFELDGSAVTSVDTAGLQLLIAARRAAEARNLAFGWHAVSEHLRTTGEFLGLGGALGLA